MRYQGKLLVFVLLLVNGFLAAFNFLLFPMLDNCVFANKILCLTGKRFEKYNWRGDFSAVGYRLYTSSEVKAPFDGSFVFSPVGVVNFEGREVGLTPVFVFENDQVGSLRLYVDEAVLLKGQAAVHQVLSAPQLTLFPRRI